MHLKLGIIYYNIVVNRNKSFFILYASQIKKMGVYNVDRFVIDGGRRLDGEITVQGAKNAVLPILAATVLNGGKNVIHNCPKLRDVEKTMAVLKGLGCKVIMQGNTVTVDSGFMSDCRIDEELMRQMRSSIIFLGAIIGRCKEAVVSMPGGCEIGARPIDLHLKALKELGITITESHGYIYCKADKLKGCDIHLDFPSVGATENIMLAAAMAEGVTVVSNAAREPEILDLQNFLNRMGAKISGAGESVIRIEGVSKLYGVDHTIMPDRIAAATYLACAAATGGRISLKSVRVSDMTAILNALNQMGAKLYTENEFIYLTAPKRLKAIHSIRTMPHPGFPTDFQSPFLALCAMADGTSVLTETIFENRFQNVEELVRMGADIKVDGRTAVIIGTKNLSGANVIARELRGGASLIVAGLAASGVTNISNIEYIDRGYEDIDRNLRACGANIQRVETEVNLY